MCFETSCVDLMDANHSHVKKNAQKMCFFRKTNNLTSGF